MSIPILYGPCLQPIGTDQGEKRKLFSDLWACWPQRRCWLQWRSKDWWMLEAVCNGSTVPDTIWLILPLHEKEKKQKNTTKDKEHCEQCSPLQCPSFIPSVMDTFPLCVFFRLHGWRFSVAKFRLSSAAYCTMHQHTRTALAEACSEILEILTGFHVFSQRQRLMKTEAGRLTLCKPCASLNKDKAIRQSSGPSHFFKLVALWTGKKQKQTLFVPSTTVNAHCSYGDTD